MFAPSQPFGLEAGNGHTGVRAAKASVMFNANTGGHTIESHPSLKPLEVILKEPSRTVRFEGNNLRISQDFKSNQELTEFINSIFFGLPALLNIEFADPPVVDRVEGVVGGVQFRWELESWKASFRMTTQEKQEQSIATAWERMGILSNVGNRRLLGALHYFHVAVRLERRGFVAGEFLPEMLLNLSKVLEVLFPPSGDGKTREAARQGLTQLGYSTDEIEAYYLPAMALRNELDVGHVDLSVFSPEQLALIHGYVARAEEAFRELLGRVLQRVHAREYSIEPYELKRNSTTMLPVVERLKKYASKYSR